MTRALSSIVAIACAFAVTSLAAASAHAQSCGGGGDGGDGGDGGGYGGGSDSSSSEEATPACVDESNLVGHTECTRFGDGWDASSWPELSVSLGMGARYLPLGDLSFTGESTHGDNPHRLRVDGGELASAEAWLVPLWLRATGGVTRRVYVGAELEVAVGGAGGDVPSRGGPAVAIDGISALGGGAIVGFGVPIGSLELRAEALIGGRYTMLSVRSMLMDCIADASVGAGTWVVEPRLAIDTWATPWVAIGAFAGTDALRGGFDAGLTIAVHTRAFAGAR